jgi:hypothetical protein
LVARVAELGQRAAAPLEIARRDVVEHKLTVLEVAAREPLLDPLLALCQPIERGVEVVLVGAGDTEL